jgi:DNA mismatch repair protein MSH5
VLLLRSASPSNLIASDGAGLFCSVLKHLIGRGPSCPKVLAATHFHEVFREDMLDPETLSVSFLHMQVMLTAGNGEVLGMSYTQSRGEDPSSEDDEPVARSKVRPGEAITYLYR